MLIITTPTCTSLSTTPTSQLNTFLINKTTYFRITHCHKNPTTSIICVPQSPTFSPTTKLSLTTNHPLHQHSPPPTFSPTTGTIMGVTILDPHSQSKHSRFMGICINKADTGLRSNFTLRNSVDEQGCLRF